MESIFSQEEIDAMLRAVGGDNIMRTDAVIKGAEHKTPDYERGYKDGLNDAWKTMRKFLNMDVIEREKAFGVNQIGRLAAMPVPEAIEKLKAWEEEKDEEAIHIGDEIRINGENGVVVTLSPRYNILWEDGKYTAWCSGFYDLVKRKTGRHFDAIEEVLKQMQEET